MMVEKGGEQQIYADDSERLLLQIVLMIQHPHMNDDLAVFVPRMCLIFDTHPPVALVGALEIPGRYGIGEREECRCIAPRGPQALQVEPMLVVQHALKPLARDVALRAAINGVADRHVVGRNRLGNGPGRAAHFEEPARYLLAGPDFGEGAVSGRVEVDLQGLLVGAEPRPLLALHATRSYAHTSLIDAQPATF